MPGELTPQQWGKNSRVNVKLELWITVRDGFTVRFNWGERREEKRREEKRREEKPRKQEETIKFGD